MSEMNMFLCIAFIQVIQQKPAIHQGVRSTRCCTIGCFRSRRNGIMQTSLACDSWIKRCWWWGSSWRVHGSHWSGGTRWCCFCLEANLVIGPVGPETPMARRSWFGAHKLMSSRMSQACRMITQLYTSEWIVFISMYYLHHLWLQDMIPISLTLYI